MRRAFALVAIDKVDISFEVCNGVNRIAIVNLVSACIQNDQAVKHLEYLRTWLVNDCKDKFSLECEFF